MMDFADKDDAGTAYWHLIAGIDDDTVVGQVNNAINHDSWRVHIEMARAALPIRRISVSVAIALNDLFQEPVW